MVDYFYFRTFETSSGDLMFYDDRLFHMSEEEMTDEEMGVGGCVFQSVYDE